MNTAVVHAVFALVLVIAYTVLTALGDDGNALLALLAGQGVGLTADSVGKKLPN